jgi:hypothetical protein
VVFALLPVLSFMTGCGSSAASQNASLSGWQGSVEHYIHEYGKDDPAVLGDLTIADGRKGFAVLGQAVPTESQDAVGLLLAHRPIAGKPSFVYLVGFLEKQDVRDVRLAVLTMEGGKPHWEISPANAAALAAYRKYREAAWRQRFPGRKEPPLAAMNFPAPDDVFSLNGDATNGGGGSALTVTHSASGASWSLAPGGNSGAKHG